MEFQIPWPIVLIGIGALAIQIGGYFIEDVWLPRRRFRQAMRQQNYCKGR